MSFMLNKDRGCVEMETQFSGRSKVTEKLDLHLHFINPKDTAGQYIFHIFSVSFLFTLNVS